MRFPGKNVHTNPDRSPPGQIASTIVVMVSTLLSRILGFVRIAVIGAIFGASGNADVLNLVFNIPNNLRKLLAEGALSSAFIPALSRSHVEDTSLSDARMLVRQLIGFQLLVLIPIIGYAIIWPERIISVILDFPEPERQILAAQLFRWLILYLLLISVAAVLMGTLNAHHRFLIPALAPLWFSLAVIFSVLLFHERYGVFSMVIGVLIGGIGQLLLQVPAVLRWGYSLIPTFRFRTPRFRHVLRQWLPVVTTSSVFVINQQIALFFASGLPDGSGSAMTNALVFWQLPFGIFAASITTVLFPRMSRQHAEGDTVGLSNSVDSGLRGLVLLLVPAGAGLALLSHELIAVALQRGAFDVVATERSATVLLYYSIGLFSVGGFNFLQRVFYACDDYKTPLYVSIFTVFIDVLLSLWLKESILEVAGLALANSIAFTVGLLLYLKKLHRSIPAFTISGTLRSLLKAGTATAAAVAIVLLLRLILNQTSIGSEWWRQGSTLNNAGLLAGINIPPLLVVGLIYRIMGFSLHALKKADLPERK